MACAPFVVALALALIGPSGALACSAAEGHHCYAITSWSMNTTRGEKVYGAFSNIQTFYANVPRWASGDRLNNEMWVGFGGTKWVEGGATVGDFLDATTPYYFVARELGGGQYWEFDYAGASPGYNTWYGLYLDEPNGPNGTWCATWAWDSKPDFCFPGFWTASAEVEAGLEFATTQSSGADNNGRSVGWAEWTDGSWHETWSGAYTHAQGFSESPLCVNAPAPGYTYGSVAFAVPGC